PGRLAPRGDEHVLGELLRGLGAAEQAKPQGEDGPGEPLVDLTDRLLVSGQHHGDQSLLLPRRQRILALDQRQLPVSLWYTAPGEGPACRSRTVHYRRARAPADGLFSLPARSRRWDDGADAVRAAGAGAGCAGLRAGRLGSRPRIVILAGDRVAPALRRR